MTIQINTDKTINGDEKTRDYITIQVAEELKRFDSHISRIEIHLKDLNGGKGVLNDKSCLLEARIEGRDPIAVNMKADTVDLAVSGAIDKIKTSLETIIGRVENH